MSGTPTDQQVVVVRPTPVVPPSVSWSVPPLDMSMFPKAGKAVKPVATQATEPAAGAARASPLDEGDAKEDEKASSSSGDDSK